MKTIKSKTNINRRDFIKMSAAVAGGLALTSFRPALSSFLHSSNSKPNIILLLFDAMSARDISLYGFSRRTTPNLERFAERAIVYHSHFSAGNFTPPGTASMLMGMYPWKHRAFNMHGLVHRSLVQGNLFSLLGEDYYRYGYAQNIWAKLLLDQFENSLDKLDPVSTFNWQKRVSTVEQNLTRDSNIAYLAYEDLFAPGQQSQGGLPGSPLLFLYDRLHEIFRPSIDPTEEYPHSLPTNGFYYYRLQDVFEGINEKINNLKKQSRPFFAYFHLWAPHEPSTPQRDFVGLFDDQQLKTPWRPRHPLTTHNFSEKKLYFGRQIYDEYISNVDYEFGKLFDKLERNGTLENTCLIITSDHGQMYERGQKGHLTPMMFDPLLRIPLLISLPGQSSRQDIFTPTSNTDILPTLLNMAGREIPENIDGSILPGLGGREISGRPIISVEAKSNSAFLPLKMATISMVKDEWKLIYYLGYSKYLDMFELYNLASDPYEKKNLVSAEPAFFARMKGELMTLLEKSNQSFLR